MIKNRNELIIPHPTTDFYRFLCSNKSCKLSIDKRMLDIDLTAYFIEKHPTIEETVDYIEHKYELIFLYEARRWLGRYYQFNKKPSLLDFSNCFNLSIHQNIYLFKNEESDGRLLGISIQPTRQLLDWIVANHCFQSMDIKQLNLNALKQDASICLVRQSTIDDLVDFISYNYQEMAKLEQQRIGLTSFPSMHSRNQFSKYFKLAIHQHVKFLTPQTQEI